MSRSKIKVGGAVFALLMLAMHLYFYELKWVYQTPDGNCVAIAHRNELHGCVGELPKLYQTANVPYGTTIETVWKK